MKVADKDKKFIPIIIAFVVVGIVVIGLLAFGERGSSGTKSDAKAGTTQNTNDDSMSMDHSSKDTAASDSSAVEATAVTIDNYAFMAPSIKVKVGQTVTWTNMDTVKHNVVADTPSDDAPNGPLIGRGETYQFTFKKAGTYTYHCDPHPYMKAKVIVTE